MNIYVSNLGFNILDADLKNLFAEYGTVSSAKVIMDKETGRSRGFGFVEIANDEAAQKAIKALDGKVLDERPIKVSEARPKKSNGYSSSRF
jgi:RNA recognition motif-containing protein